MRYLAVPLSVLLLTAHVHAEEFVFHHENVLGTSAELRIHANSRSIADAAEEQMLAQIDRCASVLSTYDPNSEVSRWIAGDLGTKVSSELYGFRIHSLLEDDRLFGTFCSVYYAPSKKRVLSSRSFFIKNKCPSTPAAFSDRH